MMKKLYQKTWMGIDFCEFAKVSSTKLAGAEFYEAFYNELFDRYRGYEDLDHEWLIKKRELADWICQFVAKGSRILSVGCGIGYIEYCLCRSQGELIEIHAQDHTPIAHKWLRKSLPQNQIHYISDINNTYYNYYDLIYLSAVDYALSNHELINILSNLRPRLNKNGRCLLISASFLGDTPVFEKFREFVKDMAKMMLEKLHLYNRGQLWGWKRNRDEYVNLMSQANFNSITDGCFVTEHQNTYYIIGMK